jgi:sigma-B regulation protein RsbQ
VSAITRNNVVVVGDASAQPMPFSHGFGCDQSLCRYDPAVARELARVTFLSDNRADRARVQGPTVVLQCGDDPIAALTVGEYVHQRVPGARMATTLRWTVTAATVLVYLQATGHCPDVSAPQETIDAIRGVV